MSAEVFVVVTNPFGDENGVYLVLANGKGQYSLWPSFADVPDGWTVVLDEASRQQCLDYVNEHWAGKADSSLFSS
jgi:MbtH protein